MVQYNIQLLKFNIQHLSQKLNIMKPNKIEFFEKISQYIEDGESVQLTHDENGILAIIELSINISKLLQYNEHHDSLLSMHVSNSIHENLKINNSKYIDGMFK